MKSNRFLIRYKHDIIGKFKDINSVIGKLDDYQECPSTYFVPFSIVHGTIIKMISTSRDTMRELFQQESVLNVVREFPKDLSLKKMNIEGIELFFDNTSDGWKGYLSLATEDEDEMIFIIGKMVALLPNTRTIFNLNNPELEKKLTRLAKG